MGIDVYLVVGVEYVNLVGYFKVDFVFFINLGFRYIVGFFVRLFYLEYNFCCFGGSGFLLFGIFFYFIICFYFGCI